MAVTQAVSWLCLWILQRLALHTGSWHAVITSQLAGNGLAKIAPGGGAVGAALQYRLLVQAGIAKARAVAGLTAANLLVFAVMLGLPVLALPALLRGSVNDDLETATLIGVAYSSRSPRSARCCWRSTVPSRDSGARSSPCRQQAAPQVRTPYRAAAAAAAGARSHPRNLRTALDESADRHQRPVGLRLRDAPRGAGGRGLPPPPWTGPARVLRRPAIGADPDHPRRPRVRGGWSHRHAHAGRRPGRDAVLATFAYRLFSYWLPLPLGLLGLALHRRRWA